MSLSNQLFNAILSMDAYNRGYNASIELSDNVDGTVKIGNATIVDNKGDLAARDIGFYALAYDTNGDGNADTIAYRGTDDLDDRSLLDPISDDMEHGWTLGAGDLDSEQGKMAVQFYQEVAGTGNYFTSGITLTGHSLGGGLSGFVGALYDKDAYIYDSMTYDLAAARATNYEVTYEDALGDTYTVVLSPDAFSNFSADYPGSTILSWEYQNPDYVDFVYGGNTPINPDNSGMNGYYIEGEVLANMTRYDDANYSNANAKMTVLNGIDLIPGINPIAEAEARHSQSTLIITMFGEEEVLETDYLSAVQYFWPVLYDDDFANEIGIFNDEVDGILQDQEKYSDILRSIIAYSAIEHDEDAQGNVISQSVFGDTGIRALYDDANDLGKAITVAGAGSAIETYATDISKAFVQFSGQLALAKIEQSDFVTATNGVLTYTPDAGNQQLSIDFTDTLWAQAATAEAPVTGMIARFDLLTSLFADMGNETEIRAAMANTWGDDSFNAIERVTFAVDDDVTLTNAGDRTLVVGGNGVDTVRFLSGTDVQVKSNFVHGDHGIVFNADVITLPANGGHTYGYLNDYHHNDYIYSSHVGYNYDVSNQIFLPTIDYSQISGALDFNIDSNGFVISEQIGSGQDSYINVSNASGGLDVSVAFIGTQYGDTVDIGPNLDGYHQNGDGHSGFEMWMGAGDDTLTISDQSSIFKAIYTGGHDVVQASNNGDLDQARIEFIQLAPSIRGENIVSLSESNKTIIEQTSTLERFTIDLEIDFGGLGSLTLKNVNGHKSAGSDQIWNTSDDQEGRTGLPSIVDWSGSEVVWHIGSYNTSNSTFVNLDTSPYAGGVLTGTNSNDTITGYGHDDVLDGSSGQDSINGNGGNDTLVGGAGNDILDGGSGIDTVDYSSATSGITVTLSTGWNDDGEGDKDSIANIENIIGTSSIDSITGDALANEITGGAGADQLFGGAGNDTFIWNQGDGDDVIQDNSGSDTLRLGAGITSSDVTFSSDTTDLFLQISGVTITLKNHAADSGQGIETLAFNDGSTLDLTSGVQFEAQAGGGTLQGTSGDDALVGGAGVDYLYGRSGNDTYHFETIADLDFDQVIDSAGASDIVTLGAAISMSDVHFNDTLYAGQHLVVFAGFSGNGFGLINQLDTSTPDTNVEFLQFTNGFRFDLSNYQNWRNYADDGYTHAGNAAHEVVIGGAGDDTFDGQGGNDYFIGGAGNDQLFGGDGIDTVDYSEAAARIVLNLHSGSASEDGHGGADSKVKKIENVVGTDQADIVTGSNDANVLTMGAGDDFVQAKAGADTLYGGAGADDLRGGEDDDILYGGIGNDDLYGNQNADILYGEDGADRLYGGADNDILYGGEGDDIVLSGEFGDDLIYGGNGNDLIHGNQDNDTLYGEAGNDTVKGQEGNDTVYGGDGDDTVVGDSGSDILYGGAGLNTLIGGTEDDTFVFETASAFDAFDFIQDFSVADGDMLDLSDLLTDYDAGAGNVLTDFVQITEAGSSSLLYVDTTGTGTFGSSNLIAKLVGTNDISAGGSGTNATEAEILGITII